MARRRSDGFKGAAKFLAAIVLCSAMVFGTFRIIGRHILTSVVQSRQDARLAAIIAVVPFAITCAVIVWAGLERPKDRRGLRWSLLIPAIPTIVFLGALIGGTAGRYSSAAEDREVDELLFGFPTYLGNASIIAIGVVGAWAGILALIRHFKLPVLTLEYLLDGPNEEAEPWNLSHDEVFTSIASARAAARKWLKTAPNTAQVRIVRHRRRQRTVVSRLTKTYGVAHGRNKK